MMYWYSKGTPSSHRIPLHVSGLAVYSIPAQTEQRSRFRRDLRIQLRVLGTVQRAYAVHLDSAKMCACCYGRQEVTVGSAATYVGR